MRAVVFSRDRPAQLDLLLRSLERHAPGRFEPIVVWRATGPSFLEGYRRVGREHPEAELASEGDLAAQVRFLVRFPGLVTFFTDDDVLFAPVGDEPESLLDEENVIAFSLRLGRNTTVCYPHRSPQRLPRPWPSPSIDVVLWRWAPAERDFGYPLSLDGHVVRAGDVAGLIAGSEFRNPNELEGLLARRAGMLEGRPLLASYRRSRLVSIPANRVTETAGNRHGETWPADPAELCAGFLEGKHLDLDLDFSTVDAAHVELPLRWAEEVRG